MAQVDPNLPMNGEHAKIVLFYGGARVPGVDGYTTSWSVKEVGKKFRDPLVGRRRLRTDKKVDGYDADLEVQLADLTLINFLEGIDATREASGTLKELAVGLEFQERLGAVEGVLIGKCVASWEMANKGQSERLTGKITLEGETYGALQL